MGDGRLAMGDERQETENQRQEIGDLKWETMQRWMIGDRKWEMGTEEGGWGPFLFCKK